MANQFTSLPAPAANGAGAWVDVSTYGGLKTVTVRSTGFNFQPQVTIEITNQAVPTIGAPACPSFQTPGEQTFTVASRWMRAVVTNYRGGPAPDVELGGDDEGALFANLPVPAGNGAGASVDVHTLGAYKTVTVGGAFRGGLQVEISEDGGATFATAASFSGVGGQVSFVATADFARVSRNGVPEINPGTPVVNLGGVLFGGGAASLIVEDEGVSVPGAPHTTLNFTGAGVMATDAGGGVVDVTIPGGATAGGSIMYWGVDNVGAAADSRFIPPGHDSGLAPTVNVMQIPAPRAGTLRNLFVRHNAAGGNGNAVVYTVLVNGVATTITLSLVTGAVGQASDLVHTVAIAQGDRISLRASKAAGVGGGNVDVEASLEVV